MRILVALAAILSTSLAGCGQSGGNGQNMQNAQNAAGGLPAPGAGPAGTAADAASGGGFRDNYRTLNITTCVGTAQASAVRRGTTEAVDFRSLCTCYIDQAMAGVSDEQLRQLRPGAREQGILQQCARDQGLMPTGPAGTR
jgi:hypothetical protein